MVDKYPVITLCGSTRFKNAFMEAQKRLTIEGNIVISVGLFGHSGDQEVWDTIGSGVINLYKYTPIFSDGGKPELFEDDVFKITIPLNK